MLSSSTCAIAIAIAVNLRLRVLNYPLFFFGVSAYVHWNAGQLCPS